MIQKLNGGETGSQLVSKFNNNADKQITGITYAGSGTLALQTLDGTFMTTNIPYPNSSVVDGIFMYPGLTSLNWVADPGQYVWASNIYSFPGGNITLNPGDALYPRYDVIYLDGDNVLKAAEGTPDTTPVVPSGPAGAVKLLYLYVEAGVTGGTSGVTVVGDFNNTPVTGEANAIPFFDAGGNLQSDNTKLIYDAGADEVGITPTGCYISCSDYLNLFGNNSVYIESLAGGVSIQAAANAAVAASSELYLIGNDFVSVESSNSVGIQGTENVSISTKLYNNSGEVINIGNTDELNPTPTTGITIQSTNDITVNATNNIDITANNIEINTSVDFGVSSEGAYISAVDYLNLFGNNSVYIESVSGDISITAGDDISIAALGEVTIVGPDNVDIYGNTKASFGVIDGEDVNGITINTSEILIQSTILSSEITINGATVNIDATDLILDAPSGATYAADYSANFTDRSLVDKEYVDNIRPYRVYTALLRQSGTTAPNAIVLENTLGFTPTFSYEFAGEYRINTADPTGFVVGKTVVFIQARGSIVGDVLTYFSVANNTSFIEIMTTNLSGTPTDGLLSLNDDNKLYLYTPIEIRIYN